MKRALILTSFLGLCAGILGCQTDGGCQVSGSGNLCIVGGPSALPSATPLPSPGSTPDPCRVEAVRVGFNAGVQLPAMALGSTEQLDATPVNSSGEVPKGCNVAREPVWTDLTPSICVHVGSGYNPFLRALRVGTCSVTANVANVVSPPFSVEVR